MKCPKCGYLGFETGDRCRNCGYDFSLTGLVSSTSSESEDELILKTDAEEAAPTMDLALGKEKEWTPAPKPREEFPLFVTEGSDAQGPLTKPRAAPRPPLSVRRATPEVPRLRPRPTPHRSGAAPFDLPPLAGLGLAAVDRSVDPEARSDDAPRARRVLAALGDLIVLGGIDAVVVYFTLRLSGLDFADIILLPRAPLLSFLLLLNGGYFVTFAAFGGQSIGQMALGLRVVGEDGMPLAFGTATLCTLAWLFSTLPFGLGLWFALGRDHRTLHDRLTATRVVLA